MRIHEVEKVELPVVPFRVAYQASLGASDG